MQTIDIYNVTQTTVHLGFSVQSYSHVVSLFSLYCSFHERQFLLLKTSTTAILNSEWENVDL